MATARNRPQLWRRNDIDGGSATITSSILTGNSATIDGGAIYVTSNSEVTITASNLSGNEAERGGALFLWGDTATLIDSAFNDNIALSSPAQGGGIYNRAAMTISGSTINGNQSGDGGGIDSQGELTITDSTINGNQADANGGGIDSNAALTLINSTVSGNQAGLDRLRNGGGIWSDSPLIITASTISGNSTSEQGGGIFINFNSIATITASTISGNQSGDHGGGIFSTNGSTASLINSTLSGNQSGDSWWRPLHRWHVDDHQQHTQRQRRDHRWWRV